MQAVASLVVGHQGGWDEAALFLIPVVVALAAVKLVERRQRMRRRDAEAGAGSAPENEEPPDGEPRLH